MFLHAQKGSLLYWMRLYDLQRFPVENFDPTSQSARINSDLFNKCITVSGDNWLKAAAVDDDYKIVNTYEEKWKDRYELREGKIISAIVPFELSLTSSDSSYINFYFRFSPGIRWIITNILLTGIAAFILYRMKRDLKYNMWDLLITLFGGIYGFISIFIFPNKFYSETR